MKRLVAAWKQHPVMTAGFLLAVLFTVLFAVRTVIFTLYWANPAHRNSPLESWMTPRYVARSWNLPQDVVLEALSLERMPGRLTLSKIAARQGVSVEELERRITTAAERYRAGDE